PQRTLFQFCPQSMPVTVNLIYPINPDQLTVVRILRYIMQTQRFNRAGCRYEGCMEKHTMRERPCIDRRIRGSRPGRTMGMPLFGGHRETGNTIISLQRAVAHAHAEILPDIARSQ